MNVTVDRLLLPPILTDGKWSFTWRICGTDENNTLDQTGQVYDVILAPLRVVQPPAADVRQFASPKVSIVGADITLTLANADMASGWKPGHYGVELRKQNGSDWEPVWLGTVQVFRGFTQLAEQGGGGEFPAQASAVRAVPTQGQRVVVLGPAAAISAEVLNAAAQIAQDAQAVHDDREAADADAEQTAQDRIATGQDRTATGQDRIATGQDRTATGQDRTATGQDRTATGQDRAAVEARTHWVTKTGNYTLQPGDRIQTDSSGGSFNLTIPASLADGDQFTIRDSARAWGSNPVFLLRGGHKIQGVADDLALRVPGVTLALSYLASTDSLDFI